MYLNPDSPRAETVSILGVEFFFVLSGYVLAPQILRICFDEPSASNLGIFWVRRWMRTIPPYFVALLVVSLTSQKLFSADFYRYCFYLQNLVGQHNTDDYYSIAWSLSVEEWFYLTFPLFCLMIGRFLPRSLSPAVCTGLLYIALISAARMTWGDNANWGADVRRVVIYRMDAIAWGFLLNIAVRRIHFLRGLTTMQALAGFVIIAGLALVLTFTMSQRAVPAIEAAFPFYAPAMGAAAIIFTLKLDDVFLGRRTLTNVGLFLGRISYSTYLFHLLVLSAIAPLAGVLTLPLLLPVYLALTVVVTSLMYLAVEAPVLAARPDYVKKMSDVSAAG